MQNFIFWPDKNILKLLPIPFRARYKNVQSITYCFEVEIQKPPNPVVRPTLGQVTKVVTQ